MISMALINQIKLTNQQDDSYQLINQYENDLNRHVGISTVKKEMMVEQIITKELIFQNEQDAKLDNRIGL